MSDTETLMRVVETLRGDIARLRADLDDMRSIGSTALRDTSWSMSPNGYFPRSPVPDGDGASEEFGPYRTTLERNDAGAGTAHDGEWQIANVDTVASGVESVPTFTPDENGDGSIVWKDSSTFVPTDDRTVERNSSSGDAIEGSLQVYDADTVVAGHDSIPYMQGPNTGGSPSTMQWAELDSSKPSEAGNSLSLLPVTAQKSALEISGFFAGTDHDPDPSYKVVMRNSSAKPAVDYATQEQMQKWLIGDNGLLPWTNGYVIDNSGTPSVSFTSGYVIWGTARIGVTGTAGGAITSGKWWGITVGFNDGSPTASWVEKDSASDFLDTSTTFEQEYYQFNIEDGKGVIGSIAQAGNWKIPSVFAPD